MRLAFSADARRLAFDERYRSALASSFSNVELGGFRAGDAALSRALAGALRGLGLRLSVHLPHDYRPAGPSHSRLALAEGLRWLELAAGLGAERAVVHARPGRGGRPSAAAKRSTRAPSARSPAAPRTWAWASSSRTWTRSLGHVGGRRPGAATRWRYPPLPMGSA
jgi:sugar phosphate isomerase/epimerase